MARRTGKMTGARRVSAAALIAGMAWAAPAPVGYAQGVPATLIADDISFEQGSETITARGGVEVFYEGARLRAQSITYTGAGDRISVEGPLTLIDPSGNAIIVADFADLSADLRDGVLQSARLVLDRQLQIAATRIDRVEGRYSQAYQAVASSCEVCEDNPIPLWEIRARRIIHDEEAQQLYFESAQFRVLGVPVIWLPQMRLPDPTLERATGFLSPSIRATDTTGTQIKVPYFIALGDHADLTLTPWIGLGDSQTVELRYRQLFRNGRIEAEGSLTADELTDDDIRGHLFANGSFRLPRDLDLTFRIEGVTDEGYLTTYGFPDPDLLQSDIRIGRTEADTHFDFGLTNYVSLRDGDDNDTLPTRVADGRYVHRFEPDRIGGIAELRLDALGYLRPSDVPGTDTRGTPRTDDDRPQATDTARLTAVLDWRRTEVLPGGFVLTVETALAGDLYASRQNADPDLNDTEARLTPYGALELRYPLHRAGAGGVSHLLEPVVQVAWSETQGGDVPVEESAIVEFDEANLFALDRFPGADLREEGRRAALGIGYTRIAPGGWSAGVTAGVILRADEAVGFTPGSGLDGRTSDWLVAAHLTFGDGFRVVNRALFDEDFDFTSNEFAFNWSAPDYNVRSTYTWLEADPFEGRPEDTGEWTVGAGYRFDTDWTAGVSWRYDFAETEPTRAGLNLGYETECVDVDFTVTRRYTSAPTLEATTEFGVTIGLNGFGAGREGRSRARTCRN
ncbi:LPS assembly protein LptD [Roseibacterium sp. SDUM158017]|uniref:LPS-assembly protein LptD n=1 Tax=Roseicyclus salinarum TaxID=3036773 RepID=UPI00241515B5|nr:LPS assembly protein LptD [Roseibacterium sp. SDUM158017]MDG4648470.1 LPS assembly protein LptD [Roseibacterium sp. SDUM158017]